MSSLNSPIRMTSGRAKLVLMTTAIVTKSKHCIEDAMVTKHLHAHFLQQQSYRVG